MMNSFFIVVFTFVKISLIAGFPISDSRLERALNCDLSDPGPSCSSNFDYSSVFFEADSVNNPSLNEAISKDESNLIESSGQYSLTEDLISASSNADLFAAGDVNQEFPSSAVDEVGSNPDSSALLDSFTGKPINDLGDDSNLASIETIQTPGYQPLPKIYSYICQEHGDICQQFIDGAPTTTVRYAICSIHNTKCRLCDSSGQDCDPDAGWDKQAIPSPDNPDGQPWNHCRNKKCGACENAARMVGFLSLGVIPGCGPPIFDR